MDTIPYSAWEQAPFFVLLAVFFVWILTWQNKRDKERDAAQAEREKEQQDFQEAQSDKWQSFINELNDKSWERNKEQRDQNNACLSDVNKGMSGLTQVIGNLVQSVEEMRKDDHQFYEGFREHDMQAKEIKLLVEQNGKTAPRPRSKPTKAKDV